MTADLRAAITEVWKQKIVFISSEPGEIAPLGNTSARGVMIRDPDGHTLLLRSP